MVTFKAQQLMPLLAQVLLEVAKLDMGQEIIMHKLEEQVDRQLRKIHNSPWLRAVLHLQRSISMEGEDPISRKLHNKCLT